MTTPSASKHLADAAQPPELMDAVEYQGFLEQLVASQQGFGKTESVAAFLLPNLRIVTETSSGDDELDTEIQVGAKPHYLVMDLAKYPIDYVQKLVVQDIMQKYARRVVGEAEMNGPDFKGAGLWTSKASSFEEDYNHAPTGESPNIYAPDPDAYRVCLTTDKDIKIPTQWGDFRIQPGGTLAVREKDIPELTQALKDIRSGLKTPNEALLNENGTAIFDVYGMEPDFLKNNYASVELKPETLGHARDLISSGVKVTRAP